MRHWNRQFAAVPQGNVSSVFDLKDIDAAMARQLHPTFGRGQPVLIFDASRGGDAWAWLVACWATDGKRHLIEVCAIGEVPHAEDAEQAVRYVATVAQTAGVAPGGIIADQYEFPALQALFRPYGFNLREVAWTQPSKARAVDRVERWLRDRTIVLPRHDKLRRQLAEYSERVTQAGLLTYSGRGAHDDFAQCLVSLSMADIERYVTGSPAHVKRYASQYFGDDAPPPLPHSFVIEDGRGGMTVVRIMPETDRRKRGERAVY